jgi:hypothetical protein
VLRLCRPECGGRGLSVNLNPKMTRTLLAILAAAVAAIVAFNVLIRQYGDPARDAIERETTATKP